MFEAFVPCSRIVSVCKHNKYYAIHGLAQLEEESQVAEDEGQNNLAILI